MPRILHSGRCYGAQIAVSCKTSVGIHSRAGGHAGLPSSVVYAGKNTAVGIADHCMTVKTVHGEYCAEQYCQDISTTTPEHSTYDNAINHKRPPTGE